MMQSWHRLTLNGVCFPDEGYKDIVNLESTELITVAVFTGVLLVFSVVGSVCVFRGHWVRRFLLITWQKLRNRVLQYKKHCFVNLWCCEGREADRQCCRFISEALDEADSHIFMF